MTYSESFFTHFRQLATPFSVLVILASLSACATSATTEPTEADSATTPPPSESEEVTIEEEVAPVTNCHTDTQKCPLAEPLPPGAACFCPSEGGDGEAGVAGE